MTNFSGLLDNINFDGNTTLLECGDSKYVYISGLEIFELRIFDKILDYISLNGNKMTPYVFAVGSMYTLFISTHYSFIENDTIQNGMLLISSINGLDPHDYHFCKNVLDCSKKLLGCNRIHSSWPGEECGSMEEIVENEQDIEQHVEEDVIIHGLEYTDGSNEVLKVFNQRCLKYLKRDSEFIF